MDLLEIIKTRRSIRRFKKKSIGSFLLNNILEAGRWAPSGLNNQPWLFKVLSGKEKDDLSRFTHYAHIIKSADKLILVFLHKSRSYHREKDIMAIGACIENMLLEAHYQGLGACWLGEILVNKDKIRKLLRLSKDLELMGVIALGYPTFIPKRGRRKPLNKIIIR